MTVTRLPPRRSAAIFVVRERAGDGWLTLAGAHGWLYGSPAAAQSDARALSDNLGLPVRDRFGAPPEPITWRQQEERPMAFERKDNTGSVFDNDRKTQEKHHDRSGTQRSMASNILCEWLAAENPRKVPNTFR